jgi:hypothetical protein
MALLYSAAVRLQVRQVARPELPLFRPDISQVGADRASVMRGSCERYARIVRALCAVVGRRW